jgi:hypothetical protein
MVDVNDLMRPTINAMNILKLSDLTGIPTCRKDKNNVWNLIAKNYHSKPTISYVQSKFKLAKVIHEKY